MSDVQTLRALGLFDARVPRYTSYPTAAQFGPAVGADAAGGWLAAIPPGTPVSLYLHVPFCRRLCRFCACRTQGTATAGPVAAYVETLKAELALVGAALGGPVALSQVHFGGGTPTLMSPAMIADLWAGVMALAPLLPGGEVSIEIDPCEVDAAQGAVRDFAGLVSLQGDLLAIRPAARAAARLVAQRFDAHAAAAAAYSLAI
jgi:oxygen-independent coproporphyrinogen-3 oxidase